MKPITGITIGGLCVVIAAVSFFVLFDTANSYAAQEQPLTPCQQLSVEYTVLLQSTIDFDFENATLAEIEEFSSEDGIIFKQLIALEQKVKQNNCLNNSSEWLNDEQKEKLAQFYVDALSGM